MTSSKTLKKLVSVGSAMLLAIGGSLVATAPANAAVTAAPVIVGNPISGTNVSVTPGVWPSGTATGKWYVCQTGGSTAAIASVPSNCDALYTSSSNTAAVTSTVFMIPGIANCATFCTPFGNNSSAFNLRWIETNGSDVSASAAVRILSGVQGNLTSPTAGDTSVAVIASPCTFTSSSISSLADWSLTINATARTITNIATANNTFTVSFSGAALSNGQSVSVTYHQATDPIFSCGSSSALQNFTAASTVGGGSVGGGGGLGGGGLGGGMPSGGTVTTPPTTPAISNSSASVTPGVWSGPSNMFQAYWMLCSSAHDAASGSMSGGSSSHPASDCLPFSATPISNGQIGLNQWVSTNPLTILANVNQYSTCDQTTHLCSTVSTATAGKYLAWYESDMANWVISAAVATDGSSSSSGSGSGSGSGSSSTPATVAPVWQAPVLNAVIGVSRGVQTEGGKLDLANGDFSGLQSVTIGGKSVAFTKDATTGKVTIPVPAANPGSADLTLKFDSGTITIVNGITYVAPTNVATVVERPVAIAAGTKTLSTSVSDQVLQAVFSNMSNTNLQCYAYAASNTAAAKAAAAATAAQVCAMAIKANPALKAAPVTVIVNKAKAKTSAVGIKVYH